MKTKSPELRDVTPRREIDMFDNMDRVFEPSIAAGCGHSVSCCRRGRR